MQPQMMTLLATVDGTSVIVETIFENRYMHVPELRRIGADIKVEGRAAIVKRAIIARAAVESTDLRAELPFILAGIFAAAKPKLAVWSTLTGL